MKILVIDNYDSFTFNIVHYIEKNSSYNADVFRNNEITIDKVGEYDKILISPGPGLPHDAGISLDVIKRYHTSKSILGVCLGHQAIAVALGVKLKNLNNVYHGVADTISVLKEDLLFKNIPNQFKAGKYHSWVIDNNSLPDELEVTAVDGEQNIMAIKHKQYNLYGVQFHPESILTEHGEKIIYNWLNL